jgi:hypothetical protein
MSSSQLAALLLPMRQLRSVTLRVGFYEEETLWLLANKTALQHLALCYDDAAAAAGTAAVWGQLPQLQMLEAIWKSDRAPSREQAAAILLGMSAATSLTKLVLQPKVFTMLAEDPDEDEPEIGVTFSRAVAACASLAV